MSGPQYRNPPIGSRQQTPYDELLMDRIKQLREIDDRLSAIYKLPDDKRRSALNDFHYELADMIRRAEEEYAAF